MAQPKNLREAKAQIKELKKENELLQSKLGVINVVALGDWFHGQLGLSTIDPINSPALESVCKLQKNYIELGRIFQHNHLRPTFPIEKCEYMCRECLQFIKNNEGHSENCNTGKVLKNFGEYTRWRRFGEPKCTEQPWEKREKYQKLEENNGLLQHGHSFTDSVTDLS